jgi:hypothetical protein
VHVRRTVAGQGIDLVNEDNDPSQLLAELPHTCQFSLALPIEFTHDGLGGDVDQGDVDLLRDYLGTGRLACARGTLEEDRLGTVGLVLHSRLQSYLVVYLGVVQSQQHRVLY